MVEKKNNVATKWWENL